MATHQTALIIGASRGLGLGLVREYLARGWQVIATIRKPGSDLEALLPDAGGQLEIETLDIVDPAEIAALRQRLAARKLDLLFVNAGVANDPQETVGEVATEEFVRIMVTNALSPLRVVEALTDLVAAEGTVAAMSSGLGSVADNETGTWEVYRASKAALNTLMRSFAVRQGGRRTFLVVAPGWVRTDMGGPAAGLDVATSIRGVVDTVTAHQGRGGIAFVNYQNQTVRW